MKHKGDSLTLHSEIIVELNVKSPPTISNWVNLKNTPTSLQPKEKEILFFLFY